MEIERKWSQDQDWKVITEDRAKRELANCHGDDALKKLEQYEELATGFARYRIVD